MVGYCWCHGLDDAKQSEDEVRDDPEHEAHDGPEKEQALGSATPLQFFRFLPRTAFNLRRPRSNLFYNFDGR